jgi:DNA-binding beta-propeller fold protein YncE
MGWIIGGAALYVVMLVLGNLMFFRDSVPSDFKVHLVKKITGMDSGSGPFSPAGIALMGSDKIAVSDSNSKRILVFNKDGKFLRFLGVEVSKEDRDLIRLNKKAEPEDAFVEIGGLCSVDGENVYAIDNQTCLVRGYGSDFKKLEPVNLKLLGCYGPHSVNYDGKNFLVSDTGSHRVLGVNRDAQVQMTLGGKHGDGNGEMNNPVDTVADGKGNFYVADFDNNRVQVFNEKGKFEKAIKVGARPSGLALFPDGKLIVASTEGGFVKVFKDNGKLVGSLKEDKNDVTFTSFSSVRVGSDETIYLTGPDTIVMVKASTKP